MDYHQNDGSYDKWNSSASNSSYYNQPTHSPYQGHGFEYAALVCGILSITLTCTGFLSLPLGALGVLFAVLTHRAGKKMSLISKTGIWLSCLGMISAVAILVSVFASLPALLKDDAYRSQLNMMYQQMFGIDFDAFMEEYYGVTFEE